MAEQKEKVTVTKYIVFKLKEEIYGVPVEQVRSIERIQSITRVPGAPTFVQGVINLRGVVLPVIELRKRLNFESEEYTDNTRIIIVNVDDVEVGLIVDSARDVIDIPDDQVEAAPEIVGGVEAEYIRGVAKLDSNLLIILNLDKVLNPDEIEEIKNIEVK